MMVVDRTGTKYDIIADVFEKYNPIYSFHVIRIYIVKCGFKRLLKEIYSLRGYNKAKLKALKVLNNHEKLRKWIDKYNKKENERIRIENMLERANKRS